VFSLAANREPALQSSIESGTQYIDSIDAPDATTAVMHWRTTYFKALELTHRVFWLYPRHLLEQAVESNKESLLNEPYFTSAYVHLGPFRLVEWGLGENVVFQRYDNYFMGRPRVERIVIHVIGDQNAMLASLKSGAVDI